MSATRTRSTATVLGLLALFLALGQCIPAPSSAVSGCSGGAAFYADSNDCNAYYQCDFGRGVKKQCPSGLHWSTKANSCDWPDAAGCEAGLASAKDEGEDSGDSSKSSGDSSTSEESVPGSESSSSSSESNECPEDKKPPKCPAQDPALSVFFPHPDPHWFYHCSNGVAYCKVCPANLVWNEKCDTCDWPDKNGCPESDSGDSSKSSGDESTSEESVPGSDSSSSESNSCPEDKKPPKCPAQDPALSVFFPHPDPHWFYHCSNGIAYCKVCPADHLWNTKCDTCDRPDLNGCPSSDSGDSSKSSGDASTSEESIPGSDSSSES